jgi:phage shock protein A
LYCMKCGSEMSPDDTFCSECGTQVTPEKPQAPPAGEAESPPEGAAAVPPPTPPAAPAAQPAAAKTTSPPPGLTGQPQGPPAAAAPTPKKEKGGSKWLVGVLIAAAVVAAVAVVLVLTLVVFKGGGPEAVAHNLYKAMEKGDASAVVALVDTSEMSKQQGMKTTFNKYVKANLPSGGLKFKDVKFETKIDGNSATATVVEGKVSYTDQKGKTSTEDMAGQDNPWIVYLVKKDGKWYVDTKTFADFYATQYLKEADAALVQLASDVTTQITGIQTTVSQGMQGATTFTELDARLKAVAANVDKTLADLRKQAEDTKGKYKSVESLKGVEKYREYANLRIQSVDALIEMIDTLGKQMQELSGYVSGLAANPPTTQSAANAAKQGFDNIENSYNAQFAALTQKVKDAESQANALMKNLGL